MSENDVMQAAREALTELGFDFLGVHPSDGGERWRKGYDFGEVHQHVNILGSECVFEVYGLPMEELPAILRYKESAAEVERLRQQVEQLRAVMTSIRERANGLLTYSDEAYAFRIGTQVVSLIDAALSTTPQQTTADSAPSALLKVDLRPEESFCRKCGAVLVNKRCPKCDDQQTTAPADKE